MRDIFTDASLFLIFLGASFTPGAQRLCAFVAGMCFTVLIFRLARWQMDSEGKR